MMPIPLINQTVEQSYFEFNTSSNGGLIMIPIYASFTASSTPTTGLLYDSHIAVESNIESSDFRNDTQLYYNGIYQDGSNYDLVDFPQTTFSDIYTTQPIIGDQTAGSTITWLTYTQDTVRWSVVDTDLGYVNPLTTGWMVLLYHIKPNVTVNLQRNELPGELSLPFKRCRAFFFDGPSGNNYTYITKDYVNISLFDNSNILQNWNVYTRT